MVAEVRRRWLPSDGRFIAGSAVGALLPVFAAPLLTRAYSPKELGAYQAYALLVSMLGVTATARLEMLIPAARSDRRVAVLIRGGLLLASGVAILATIPWWFIQGPIGSFQPALIRVFLPVGILLIAVDALWSAALVRLNTLQVVAKSRLAQGGLRPAVQLGLADLSQQGTGLFIGAIAGQLASCGVLWSSARLWPFGSKEALSRTGWRLYRWRRGILVGMGAALVNPLAAFALLATLAAVSDSESYGIIAMTAGFTGIPVTLLAPAGRQILQRELARHVGDGREVLAALTRYLMQWLPLSLAVALFGWIVGPWIIPPLLGEQWRASADYIGPLAVVAAIQLWLSPVGAVFPMTGKLGWQLVLDIGRAVAIAGWVVGASSMMTPSLVVLGGALVTAVGYLLMLTAAHAALGRWRRVAMDGTEP